MKTELIAGTKLVVIKGIDTAIITTASGAQVFVPKHQMDANAETISYNERKAGHTYTRKDGTQGTLEKPSNEFVGCGRQTVKKYSSVELYAELQKLGITPTLSM